MAELAELVKTAGGEVRVVVTQRRAKPHGTMYVGKGKVDEIGLMIDAEDLDVAVIGDSLAPRQQRFLEEAWGVPVVDRSEVILDIFAQRAQSREGKLQVELAQLEYLLPRLIGRGQVLSRLAGGIGTRGPGETQLEVDRRRIRIRLAKLREEMQAIRARREVSRRGRDQEDAFTAALVGYTNAGKSTLLNALAGSNAYVDDKLFATLDPLTRAVEAPDGQKILVTDTVGFIERLPHNLVAAFSATLEEALSAELLLHVVDASDPVASEKITVVYGVLEDLGVADRPSVLVFNKVDIATEERLAELPEGEGVIRLSALTGEGLDALNGLLGARASERLQRLTLLVPFSQMGVLDHLHKRGRILDERYEADGVLITADLPHDLAGRLRGLVTVERTP